MIHSLPIFGICWWRCHDYIRMSPSAVLIILLKATVLYRQGRYIRVFSIRVYPATPFGRRQQRSFREANFLPLPRWGSGSLENLKSGGDIMQQMFGLEKCSRILQVNAMEAYLVTFLHRSNYIAAFEGPFHTSQLPLVPLLGALYFRIRLRGVTETLPRGTWASPVPHFSPRVSSPAPWTSPPTLKLAIVN